MDASRCACGATLPAGAAWCPQCFAPAGATAPGPAAVSPARMGVAAPTVRPITGTSRWSKGPTTFGPTGRIVATAVFVLVAVWLLGVAIATGGMGVAGFGLWTFVLGPWAMRDVWKKTPVVRLPVAREDR